MTRYKEVESERIYMREDSSGALKPVEMAIEASAHLSNKLESLGHLTGLERLRKLQRKFTPQEPTGLS